MPSALSAYSQNFGCRSTARCRYFNTRERRPWQNLPRCLFDLYEKEVSGAIGSESVLLADNSDKFPTSWSADGRFLIYNSRSATTGPDLWVLPLTGDRQPYPFRRTAFSETNGMFSPDGRWVAYTSDESGQNEVFVTPFPGPGASWRVSTAGGTTPQWRGDTAEIFYAAPDKKLMSASVTSRSARIDVGSVKPLFDLPIFVPLSYFWDVSPDGMRFLIKTPADESAALLTLVVNWPSLLADRRP